MQLRLARTRKHLTENDNPLVSKVELASNVEGAADSLKGPICTFFTEVKRLRDQWRTEDMLKAKCRGKEEFVPTQLWFRGVGDAARELKPQVYRQRDQKLQKFHSKRPNEDEIRYGFKSRAIQLMPTARLPENEKEWYFLMQHYGAPTRLLDWTDGALLALHFAVTNLREPRDVAVWILDPEWLNQKLHEMEGVALPEWPETDPWFPKPFEGDLHPRSPLAIDPPHLAPRVAVQRSHFTIHGTDENGLDDLARESSSRLVKITVGRNDIVEILDDLRTFGVVETTVFPDLEGLARELRREWGGE
jgi:FRG domain-containing protein